MIWQFPTKKTIKHKERYYIRHLKNGKSSHVYGSEKYSINNHIIKSDTQNPIQSPPKSSDILHRSRKKQT